jgi:hypothetical protein
MTEYFLSEIISNAVDIVTGYGLDDRSFGVREFQFLHIVNTTSRAHRASYPMGTQGLFPLL